MHTIIVELQGISRVNLQLGGNNISSAGDEHMVSADDLVIALAVDASSLGFVSRRTLVASVQHRLAEAEAALREVQVWLYVLHSSLLRHMLALGEWPDTAPVPLHSLRAGDDWLRLRAGSGLCTADSLLVVAAVGDPGMLHESWIFAYLFACQVWARLHLRTLLSKPRRI